MYFNGTKCRLFVLSCLLPVSLMAKDATSLDHNGLRKPLCFVENKGQVLGEDNRPRKDVQYKLSSPGMDLYIGEGKMHYQFKKDAPSADAPNFSTYMMDISLVGANKKAQASAGGELDYVENYYLAQTGGNGITAHTYSKVIYKDVYPNIDWVLYLNGNKVEYDFVVRPGGNPADIQLKYDGATALSITDDGGVYARTPMGDVTQQHPVSYETYTGVPVVSKFQLKGNVLSFATGKYSNSITIDPFLGWCTYLGGTGDDQATSVKCAGGNIYVTGFTGSVGLATGAGIYQPINGGGTYDAFVAKYNIAGAIQWCTYFGGTGSDQGKAITINNTLNGVYVVGNTTTPAGLSSAGAYHTTNNGASDIFLAKFSPANGSRTWATFIGGTLNDFGNAVACDALGNVFVGGSTLSTTTISSVGAYQGALSGGNDGYLAKFTPAGANLWATYYGGTFNDEIDAIATDATGNVVVTGQTNSTVNMASASAYQGAISGTNDAFVASFASGGTRNWGTYYGGSAQEKGNGIVCDLANNNIYVVGNTSSTAGIANGYSFQPSFGGGIQDAFLAKLNQTGAMQWSTFLGGNSADYGNSVAIDAYNNIVVGGTTGSTSGFTTNQGVQPSLSGGLDGFYAKFNSYGQNLYESYYGGSGNDFINGITTDPTNTNIIGAGYTSTNAAFTTAGSAQAAYGGGANDCFIFSMSPDTLVWVTNPYTDTLVCQGGSLQVNYTTNYNFQAGNVFTIQLSNAAGSFAAPTNIGTATATASGIVNCVIPAGTTPGTGYRIRIKSTLPAFTSPDEIINISVVATLAAPAVSGSTPVCVGQTLSLFSSSTYYVSGYSWSGPNLFASVLQNPTRAGMVAANAGWYYVSAAHNGCPAMMDSINITVSNVIPPTPWDSAGSPICSGGPLHLFADSGSGAAATYGYHWTGPAGFVSTAQNPTIPVANVINTGYYYVVDTFNGCPSLKDSVLVSIAPTDSPRVHITVAPSDTVCVGTMLNFTATTTNAGYSPTYQWMSNPTTPVVGGIYSTYSTPYLADGSTVTCIITGDVGCPDKPNDTSNVLHIRIINNNPIDTIVVVGDSFIHAGDSVMFNSLVAGSYITGYQWYINDTILAGATSSSLVLHHLMHNTTVKLQVFSNAQCATYSFSNTVTIRLSTGVANVSPSFMNIDLFPNPNNGNFNVKGKLNGIEDGNVNVEVSNAVGQVVYNGQTNIVNSELNTSISMSNLPSGIYILRLNKDGEGKVFRFMVE